MSTCAIMQPTYLPWSGYFNLAAQVDVFIFLDDVQFERRSWQNRNRILQNGAACLLTAPVRKAAQSTPIHQMELVQDEPWAERHLQALRTAYPQLRQQAGVDKVLEVLASARPARLADLNIALILALFELLGITCQTLRASELGCSGKRSAHLAELCQRVGARRYLSPQGSREYLAEDGFEDLSGLTLAFQEFTVTPYPQRQAAEFVSHLSVLDVIGQCGPEFAARYIRQGAPHAPVH